MNRMKQLGVFVALGALVVAMLLKVMLRAVLVGMLREIDRQH